MTKAEFAEELRKRGYNAAYEDGTVTIRSEGKNMFRAVDKVAKEVGYVGSFGWKGERAEHG